MHRKWCDLNHPLKIVFPNLQWDPKYSLSVSILTEILVVSYDNANTKRKHDFHQREKGSTKCKIGCAAANFFKS